MYMTPGRFKSGGYGNDVSGLTDLAIASVLRGARSAVDAYCSVPTLPQPFDFRGGSVIDEQHEWTYPTTPFEIGQRRVYPFHQPLIAISRFQIYVTDTQYVGISPDQLVIQEIQRYVEVVSLALTSAGLFNALIIPNVGLATPVLHMDYTYGRDIPEVGDYLYTDALVAGGKTVRALNQWWLTSPVPVVYADGAVQNPSSYTVNYGEGTVAFNSSIPAGQISADYHHKLPTDLADATGLIASWMFGQSLLASVNMQGLESLKVGSDLSMNRPRRLRGSSGAGAPSASEIDTDIPAAAERLAGYKFFSAGVVASAYARGG